MLRMQYAQTAWCSQKSLAHPLPEDLAPLLPQNGRLC